MMNIVLCAAILLLPTNTDTFDASLYAFNVLNLADAYTSLRAFDSGAYEWNPVLRPLSDNRYYFAVTKVALGLAETYLLKELYKKNKTVAWITSIGLNLMLGYLVYNNIKQWR